MSFRGKLLENSKEISSVALLSPACSNIFLVRVFKVNNLNEELVKMIQLHSLVAVPGADLSLGVVLLIILFSIKLLQLDPLLLELASVLVSVKYTLSSWFPMHISTLPSPTQTAPSMAELLLVLQIICGPV